METEDQAQTSTGQEGAKEATQPNQDQKQSQGDQTSRGKTYQVGGRDLTPDELFEKHTALEKDYTQKAQRLAKIERSFEEGARVEKASREVAQTQNVSPEIREAVLGIVRPEMEKELNRRMQARDQQAYWDTSFSKLEQSWDGREGKPKFSDTDRQAIIDEMRNPSNRIYDPEVLYEKLHKAEIRDFEVKQALRKQKGTTRTEKTGTTAAREPDKKTAPKSIGEASARLFERLKSE